MRLYDRLFKVPNPGKATGNYLDDLNPGFAEGDPARTWSLHCGEAKAHERFQFERHGYFTADPSSGEAVAPAFNRTVTLRDSWSRS